MAGASLEDGWKAIKVVRKDGRSQNESEILYFSPAGKKLKSKQHVLNFLRLPLPAEAPAGSPATLSGNLSAAAVSEGTSGPARGFSESSKAAAPAGAAAQAASPTATCNGLLSGEIVARELPQYALIPATPWPCLDRCLCMAAAQALLKSRFDAHPA